MSVRLCPSYMDDVTDPTLRNLKAVLRPVVKRERVDTLVGIGLSGSLIVPVIARAWHLNWAIVRKESDKTHSHQPFVGTLGDRWLFVDDLIDTGKSLAYVCQAVREGESYGSTPECEFVGAYLYADREFHTANSAYITRSIRSGRKLL